MYHLIFLGISLVIGTIVKISRESKVQEGFTEMVPSAGRFVFHLGRLGYFSYTAPAEIEKLENVLKDSLSRNEGLATVIDEQSKLPLDLRIYAIDGKKIASGSASAYFSQLKTFMEKQGLPPLDFTKQFDPLKEGLAIRDFVIFVNEHLKKGKTKERAWLTGNPENTKLAFLTVEQQKFIASVIKNRHIQPLEPKMWGKWNNVA
jgi:hypothetical protein